MDKETEDIKIKIGDKNPLLCEQLKPKFKVGDMARKPKGYEFPCTIVSVFKTKKGKVRVVGEMDGYGLLHIFNEDQLIKINNNDLIG